MKIIKQFLIVGLLFTYHNSAIADNASFKITIERNMACTDKSTVGRLFVNEKEIGRSLELPWRNNEEYISRIPVGVYSAKIRSDGVLKWRVELKKVPGRENVQIHIGNYQRNTIGCILVGSDITQENNQCKVPYSRLTLDNLAKEMSNYSAELGKNKSIPISITVEIID